MDDVYVEMLDDDSCKGLGTNRGNGVALEVPKPLVDSQLTPTRGSLGWTQRGGGLLSSEIAQVRLQYNSSVYIYRCLRYVQMDAIEMSVSRKLQVRGVVASSALIGRAQPAGEIDIFFSFLDTSLAGAGEM